MIRPDRSVFLLYLNIYESIGRSFLFLNGLCRLVWVINKPIAMKENGNIFRKYEEIRI